MLIVPWLAKKFYPVLRNRELEVHADKTKYMVMSRDQNAGRSDSIKIDNISFEGVKELKYFGISIKNKNSIQQEIKSRMLAIIQCRIFSLPVSCLKI
jgi:hypothetical protein